MSYFLVKISAFVLAAVVSGLPSILMAEDVSQGKALHDESCLKCHIKDHNEAFYTRDDRRMTSYKGLQSMVRMCDAKLGTQLFDEDMEEIGKYLNKSYYKFPEK